MADNLKALETRIEGIHRQLDSRITGSHGPTPFLLPKYPGFPHPNLFRFSHGSYFFIVQTGMACLTLCNLFLSLTDG